MASQKIPYDRWLGIRFAPSFSWTPPAPASTIEHVVRRIFAETSSGMAVSVSNALRTALSEICEPYPDVEGCHHDRGWWWWLSANWRDFGRMAPPEVNAMTPESLVVAIVMLMRDRP